MKKIYLMLIIMSIFIFSTSCQNNNIQIFQREHYITGNIVIIEPKLDETIDFPIISNDTYERVEFVRLIGENVDKVNVDITDSDFFYQYDGYYYKTIKLNFKQYQFYKSAKIEQIELQFIKNNHQFNEIFNCEIELIADTTVIDVSHFATIKRTKMVIPTSSIPSYFWVVYPKYTFEINHLIDNTKKGYKDLSIGISSTTDFNEINDTNLTIYENLDQLNLEVIAKTNVYFNLAFNLEKGEYLNEINTILISITHNNEHYNLRILNINDLSYVKERIEDYIDVGF